MSKVAKQHIPKNPSKSLVKRMASDLSKENESHLFHCKTGNSLLPGPELRATGQFVSGRIFFR